MGSYAEEQRIHKEQRNGERELRPVSGGKREKREWKVTVPSPFRGVLNDGPQWTLYRCTSLRHCEQMIAKDMRSYNCRRPRADYTIVAPE